MESQMDPVHATGVHECNLVCTHEIQTLRKTQVLCQSKTKKYTEAQLRHSFGTFYEMMMHSLGTV